MICYLKGSPFQKIDINILMISFLMKMNGPLMKTSKRSFEKPKICPERFIFISIVVLPQLHCDLGDDMNISQGYLQVRMMG